VGTYEAIAKLPNVDFELWHGNDVPNSKLKNYKGNVSFNHRVLPSFRLPVKTNNGCSSQPFFPFLFARLLFHNPDVILAEGASSILSLSVASLYSRLFKKKLILWSMGALAGREYKGIRGLVQCWVRYIEKTANAVFVYSTQAEEFFISEGVSKERIFKAVNVIDVNSKLAAIKEHGIIDKAIGFNVAFVGAIAKTKRIELLIDAVGRLAREHDDVKLHVIGDGEYLQVVKDYSESVGLEKVVVFHGRVTEGLNLLLSRYQVLALPGLGGLAIVDGMISSLPIISGQADGTEKDLINEENGFVTDEMTEDYMYEKLSILYDNPDLIKRLGDSSFSKITGVFSFDNYIRVFQKCLNFVADEE
jgi:glycosyltransferase involved in cell wall biosynthesis